MRRDYRLFTTLLAFALAFYIVGTLDEIARVVCLLAICFVVYGLWNRGR